MKSMMSCGTRRSTVLSLLLTVFGAAAPALCVAQSVTASERDALVRLRTERGGRAEDVDALIRVADEAMGKGLPAAPLTNKIREGLAKGADPQRIELVVRQMATHLDAADRLLRELTDLKVGPASGTEGAARDASVALLAEAFGGGVTPDEVREIRRVVPASVSAPAIGDALASASRGLSFIRNAQLRGAEGTAVMVEAVRQGFRSPELLDVGREVKRRESDYRAGRASLRALRDAIARGDRPDRLFRPVRPDAVGRPAPARPDLPADRPERPARPEVPQRPEQPVRPERPTTRGR